MNKWILTLLALVLLALTGCTATIYGVPQERWDAMGDQERVATMEAYQARQAALRQQREERARQQAIERERQRAIDAEEARLRQLRVDAIYRGEGVYGDLLRVRIEEGSVKLGGSHRDYQPFAFRIATGEEKEVEVIDRKGRKAVLRASYDGSNLVLDGSPGNGRTKAVRLVYEDSWEEGRIYTGLTAMGPLGLRGVTVTVQVLGEPPRDRRAGRQPHIIVIQQPAPQPDQAPIVVIKEKEKRPQRQEVVVVKDQPRKDRRDEVVRDQPNRKQPADAPPARVKITFHKGQIQIKGKHCPLIPQTIDLREGQTRTVTLQGHLGKVNVRVSYRGGEVAIDDHPGKSKAATRLSFSPEWQNGSTYRIKTTESRLIEDLDISILEI